MAVKVMKVMKAMKTVVVIKAMKTMKVKAMKAKKTVRAQKPMKQTAAAHDHMMRVKCGWLRPLWLRTGRFCFTEYYCKVCANQTFIMLCWF